MASVAAPPRERRALVGRLGAALAAAWGALTGVAPHVLHHVGPFAGAALLTGAGGKLLFAAIGFGASLPFLLRLYRRFQTLAAPALALGVFAAMFALSSFVIGPAIGGSSDNDKPTNAGKRVQVARPQLLVEPERAVRLDHGEEMLFFCAAGCRDQYRLEHSPGLTLYPVRV